MNQTSGRLLAGAALGSLLLTGCESGEELDPDYADSDTVATDATDALADALTVGETFEGDASTTVEALIRGPGADAWLRAGADYEWLAVTATTCLSAAESVTEVGWYQWAAVDADGDWYPADLDYDNERPTRQYPMLDDVAPGSCAAGRILIPIPEDAELVSVVNADRSGEPQGTWLVGEAGAPTAVGG